MCVYAEDIFLGSERDSRVEEKAVERGSVVARQPFPSLHQSTHFPSTWAAVRCQDPGSHGYTEYVMDPKDPVLKFWSSSCSDTFSRLGLMEGCVVIGGMS